jgi:hypothetical protein
VLVGRSIEFLLTLERELFVCHSIY